MRRALPSWEIRHLPHLATFYGEFTEEKIAEDHWWADLVFFHHKHDHPQDYPTFQPKIPLSVWFQSAPFMIQTPKEVWNRLKEEGVTDVERIVKEEDMDYEARWQGCLQRMMEKEENENVPELMRMSDLMKVEGRNFQLQLTCNHPTSIVFWEWSMKIIAFLGERTQTSYTVDECKLHPNLAGLPCEESATTGAKRHLGLLWGGRPEDDESGRQVVRERLGL